MLLIKILLIAWTVVLMLFTLLVFSYILNEFLLEIKRYLEQWHKLYENVLVINFIVIICLFFTILFFLIMSGLWNFILFLYYGGIVETGKSLACVVIAISFLILGYLFSEDD